MAALKRLQWSVDIAAPASMVYQILVAPESYTRWASAFGEGLYFKGSWQKGQTIRFMTPGGDGVVSDIAENRPNEFISLRHSATSSTARKTQAAKPSALGRQRTRTTPSRLRPPREQSSRSTRSRTYRRCWTATTTG
jgi:uncharacterized protein YndB with AHSA1/START domain